MLQGFFGVFVVGGVIHLDVIRCIPTLGVLAEAFNRACRQAEEAMGNTIG